MQPTPWSECPHTFLYSRSISFDLIENVFDDFVLLKYQNIALITQILMILTFG